MQLLIKNDDSDLISKIVLKPYHELIPIKCLKSNNSIK